MARIASVHSAIAQDLPGICCLAQRNALGILLYLNAKVEREQPEVTHLESVLHLELEPFNLPRVIAGNDEVIDVDADEQSPCTLTTRVDGVLCLAPGELELLQTPIELRVPS